jgi:hypothetical protein
MPQRSVKLIDDHARVSFILTFISVLLQDVVNNHIRLKESPGGAAEELWQLRQLGECLGLKPGKRSMPCWQSFAPSFTLVDLEFLEV